ADAPAARRPRTARPARACVAGGACLRAELELLLERARFAAAGPPNAKPLFPAHTPSTVPPTPLIGIGRVCTRPPICGAGPAALAAFSISAWAVSRFRATIGRRA